jgi:hypothetical protein
VAGPSSRALALGAFAVAAVLGVTAWAVRADSGPPAPFAAATSSTTAPPSQLELAAIASQGRPEAPPAAVLTPGALWPTGVSADSTAAADAFARYRGRANDVVVLFASRVDWSSITDPWIGDSAEHFAAFPGTWVVSEPMFPDPPPGADLAAYARQQLTRCATGAFGTYFQRFGRWLVERKRSASFVRIGWEANGTWFGWQAVDPAAWMGCFRDEALALLGADPGARIDWTLNAHTATPGGGDPFALYPGDDVVDVVGMDTYDQYPPSPDGQAFQDQCEMPAPTPGLCTVIAFARLHHKLFSVPEWGLVGADSNAARVGAAGGDNPAYVADMFQIFQRYHAMLAYEAYFNNADPADVRSSLEGPVLQAKGSAVYARLWAA